MASPSSPPSPSPPPPAAPPIQRTNTIPNDDHDDHDNYDDDDDDDGNDPYFSTLESVMRVAVAGFGGALAGLSFARRGGAGASAAAGRQAASALTKKVGEAAKNAAKAKDAAQSGGRAARSSNGSGSGSGGGNNNHDAKRRLPRQRPVIRSTPPSTRPYADGDLPYAWAVACTAFAGIVETTRIWSPTSLFMELRRHGGRFEIKWPGDDGYDELPKRKSDEKAPSTDTEGGGEQQRPRPYDPSLTTICDYVIGGAVAGALFRGSAVRTPSGARIDASILGGASSSSAKLNAVKAPRPLSGILPGAALGLVAGVAIVGMEGARVMVEDYFGEEADGRQRELEERRQQKQMMASAIPADIKAMSNEELMQSIENLKKGNSESQRDANVRDGKGNSTSNESEKDQEAYDLISAVGFRPHPSQ